ncbi:MAG TPA: TonB-dependent receptor [Caulobacteraceae bacterium]|jgi:iron complex outermembrane receptor protein
MRKNTLFMACAVAALAAGGGSMAQTAKAAASTAAAAPSSGVGTTVGEIVVTAEKREANLQEVPEAVTAFTAQDRNIKGISTVQDITNFTPGFTYSSALDRPAMRGLARSTNQYTADSSVAVYYDDFFSNSTFLVGRDDMLIDQVEVLVGPQGTLYGRNSIGGLINTISKRPQDEFGGEVRAIVGNFGYTKFEGTVTGQIAPHLDLRISMFDENQTQGWLRNVAPGLPSEGGVRHDPYGDIQLEYKNDSDDIWFDSYVVGFNNDRGGPGSLLGTPTAGNYGTVLTTQGEQNFNPNAPYGSQNYSTGPGVAGIIPGSVVGMIGTNNPNIQNIRDFAHNTATTITLNKAYTFTLHWTHHFDGFDVKYVGGYSQYHYELHDPYFNNDNSPISSYKYQPGAACGFVGPALGIPAAAACSPLTINPTQIFSFTTQTDWWSHEITISSTWNKPVQWVAGLYYFNETDNNPETDNVPDQAQVADPVSVLNPAQSALPNPSRDEFLLDYQDRIQSAAAYAQVDWKITPHLKVTGGFRYTLDWKHGTEEARYVYFGSDVYAGIPGLEGIFTPQNLGAALPAFDFTASQISFAPGKGICGLPVLQTAGPFAGAYTRCLSDHSQAPTGTAGIEWTPNDNTLVYARYNRGYKAFALNAGFIYANPEAAPEHVDDYEVGYKGTFGHNFTLDVDAFYYNYQNDQVPLGVTNGSITTTEFINVPKAVSDGIEVEAYWRPVRHLDLTLTYGLDHTAIQSGCSMVGGVAVGACYEDALDPFGAAAGARTVSVAANGVAIQAVKGDPLPQAPENKVAFNAVYTFEFDPGNLILSGTYIWKDKSYSEIFTRSYYLAPSWSQVDLRATWSGNHDRYEVVFFVRNLFNTLGYDAAADGYIAQNPVGNPGAGITQVPAFDLTPPRTFGAEFHYKF